MCVCLFTLTFIVSEEDDNKLQELLADAHALFVPPKPLSTYRGGWSEGKRHGFGVQKYAHGSQYSGEWKNGHKCGTGSLIVPDSKVRF